MQAQFFAQRYWYIRCVMNKTIRNNKRKSFSIGWFIPPSQSEMKRFQSRSFPFRRDIIDYVVPFLPWNHYIGRKEARRYPRNRVRHFYWRARLRTHTRAHALASSIGSDRCQGNPVITEDSIVHSLLRSIFCHSTERMTWLRGFKLFNRAESK